MVPNAVLAKELRTRMRNRYAMTAAILYMSILAAVAVIFLVQHQDPAANHSHVGVQLFQILTIFQLMLILLITPVSIAAAISDERQRQTWDLLLTTRLSSFDIVTGKLLAGLAFNVLLIFISLPVLAAVLLFGGVAPAEILRSYLVLAATIVLLGMISLFVSVLSRRPVVSVIVSVTISLLLGVGLSLLLIVSGAGSSWTDLPSIGRAASLYHMSLLGALAQADPVVALLSVLPNGNHSTLLGGSGAIDHALGLPLRLPLWGAFGLLTFALTLLLLVLSALLIRFAPLRLRAKRL